MFNFFRSNLKGLHNVFANITSLFCFYMDMLRITLLYFKMSNE